MPGPCIISSACISQHFCICVFLCLRLAAPWPSPTCNSPEQTDPLGHMSSQWIYIQSRISLYRWAAVAERVEYSREQSVIILHFAFLGVGSKWGRLEKWWWLGSIFSLSWPPCTATAVPPLRLAMQCQESRSPVNLWGTSTRWISPLSHCLFVVASLNLSCGSFWNTEGREATLALKNQHRGAEVRQWTDFRLWGF